MKQSLPENFAFIIYTLFKWKLNKSCLSVWTRWPGHRFVSRWTTTMGRRSIILWRLTVIILISSIFISIHFIITMSCWWMILRSSWPWTGSCFTWSFLWWRTFGLATRPRSKIKKLMILIIHTHLTLSHLYRTENRVRIKA